MARENRTWGYDRIVGALSDLGHRISDQTVGNILRRYQIAPAPERSRTTTWKEFIRSHRDVPEFPLINPRVATQECLSLVPRARVLQKLG